MASTNIVGIRRAVAEELGYDDRNDGFLRSHTSRSKHNYSRIHKEHKPLRVKPDQQVNWIY